MMKSFIHGLIFLAVTFLIAVVIGGIYGIATWDEQKEPTLDEKAAVVDNADQYSRREANHWLAAGEEVDR